VVGGGDTVTYREGLGQLVVAISTSESPDMPILGLSDEHLRDAMAEIARHLLALGARLAYGGDLREYGFTELLFELVARHRRDGNEGDERASVTNYLAWPVHISQTVRDLERFSSEIAGSARLVFLNLDGGRLSFAGREIEPHVSPTDADWTKGLASMRRAMRNETHARIVLGGRVDGYKGIIPGIAEESLLSLRAQQPLFLVGGFGGCTRDIARALGIAAPSVATRPTWKGQAAFDAFKVSDLNNGLSSEENTTLINTPHIDQAITLVLRGLLRLNGSSFPTKD
jgi:hypothetical protein